MNTTVTDALYERAQEALFPNGKSTSQSGMTRTELRNLERRGLIKKSYVTDSKSGVTECFWELP